MSDRFNTAAGWTLFAGIVALGLSSVSSKYFHADQAERPETMGYKIEGVAEEGAAAGPSLNTLLATGDVAKGEKVFAKCSSCHTINQGGANGIGPNLFGVVGAGIGKHAAGFAYSPDLAGNGGNWDFANLDKWLTSPKAFAAGTKMSFAGLSNPEDRANLIVYMNAQGSNLPLPAADAAPAEGAEGGAPASVDALVAAADPAKGEKVFAKCSSCHTINKGGANGIGPNLFGTMGAPLGHVAGFAYSDALKGKGGNWDAATMDAWLTSPRAFAAGTKMTFAGLSSPEDRAALIAYLSAQK
jgi:cytochrome c